MTEIIVRGIVLVLVLGIGAQWMAWRLRVPSILLLLIMGFLAGPVFGVLDPQALQGDWVFSFVSIAIGIILFEGGLSLRLSELREAGRAVLNLITLGVLITWALGALAAYYVVDLSLSLSIQIGAILTVTGPTVVIPLLRHVRPTGRVGTIAKWEGITIDPVGAILAVLVLETVLLLHPTAMASEGVAGFGEVVLHAVEGLFLTVAVSVGLSVIGAGIVVFVLYRRLVPDYLQHAVALMMVVALFALSNTLQAESGLLEATLMGIFLANQKYVPVRRIAEFKENLQILLIACLFIVLSARLELDTLNYIDGRALLFLAALIFVVRPLAVLASSVRTRLTWRELVFLSWLAPRGIVAAAVASLFAFELQEFFPEESQRLVPLVFLVIVGTVAVYGLSIAPLARALGLADPNPQGTLLMGAHAWARRIALVLKEQGFNVLMIDVNAENVERARQLGLHAEVANGLAESVLDDLELGSIGRFIALTPNDEVNALAALNFAEVFDSACIYHLDAPNEGPSGETSALPKHLRGRSPFGAGTTFAVLNKRFQEGGEVLAITLSEELTYDVVQARYGEDAILLFVIRDTSLYVNDDESQLTPEEGDTVVLLTPPQVKVEEDEHLASFERLVSRAFVLDVASIDSFEKIVRRACSLFAQQLPITAEKLARGMLEISRSGAMPVVHGVALPHYRLPGIEHPELGLVRCREGLKLDQETADGKPTPPVHAIIFLVSPQEHPGRHLRTLAHLANRIEDARVLKRWMEAEDEQELKETLLRPERYVAVELADGAPTSEYVGLTIGGLGLPAGVYVGFMAREGRGVAPHEGRVLRPGDRLTFIGDPIEIERIRSRSQQMD